jgi:hypothetical protein
MTLRTRCAVRFLLNNPAITVRSVRKSSLNERAVLRYRLNFYRKFT